MASYHETFSAGQLPVGTVLLAVLGFVPQACPPPVASVAVGIQERLVLGVGNRVLRDEEALDLERAPSSSLTVPGATSHQMRANAAGFVDVNQNSLRHNRFDNVFALGDAASAPNSKTAAAVRKQAPVVVNNLLPAMGAGRSPASTTVTPRAR